MDDVTDFKGEYPYYQATYMKGEVNFTVRGDDKQSVVNDMAKMITAYENWVGAQGSRGAMKPTGNSSKEVVGSCPDCGADVVHRSGTSKNGKPYQGNFCSNKACKYVEWL